MSKMQYYTVYAQRVSDKQIVRKYSKVPEVQLEAIKGDLFDAFHWKSHVIYHFLNS